MKKLFTNDKFFLISVLLSVAGAIMCTILTLINWPEYSYMAYIIDVSAVSTVAFYISYRKHAKNAMKGLAGFLLMGLLSTSIVATFPLSGNMMLYSILGIINVFVVLLLCVNHFIINSDHHSKSANVKLNQILLLVKAVIYIAMASLWLSGMSGIILVLYMFGIPLAVLGVTASVVCVETRLDAYRLDREAAGWTEEKGYPEGYVHEYEKNKK